MSVAGHESKRNYAKKVGALPVAGSDKEKRTDESGMAISLLASCGIAGAALPAQRTLATHLAERQAHYHFPGNGNQAALESDIALLFRTRGALISSGSRRRIVGASIRGVFGAARRSTTPSTYPMPARSAGSSANASTKKTGVPSREIALGITSRTSQQAFAQTRTGRQPQALEHRKR